MKQNTKAVLYALLAISLWSTVATAFKIALKEMNSFHLLLISTIWSAAALFILICFMGRAGNLFKLSLKEYSFSFFLALLNPIAYYLVLFRSYELLPAQIAQPLNYTWPMMLVLLSIPLLKQAPRWIDGLSLGLCFCGILLISSGGQTLFHSSYSTPGIFLALGSSVLWALYWIMNKKISSDALISMFWSFFTAIPVLFIVKVILNPAVPLWTLKGVLSSAYVGLFEMGVTFVFWGLAMKHAKRSADIGNLVYISPFLSLIWIHSILGESISISTILGLIIIVCGILSGKIFKKQTS